ncbi:MAG TPA: nucleoside hydrolase, partial [Actinomycetota bacterium]|nr:nucleoside hydrolase [Actinomycetota bacterium]
RDELEPVFEMRNEISEFYLAANAGAWEFMRAHPHGPGIDGISHPDALTIAMAIDEGVIRARGRFFVDVETRGELTSGYSVVDTFGVLERKPNAEVVVRADKERFKRMLFDLLSGGRAEP